MKTFPLSISTMVDKKLTRAEILIFLSVWEDTNGKSHSDLSNRQIATKIKVDPITVSHSIQSLVTKLLLKSKVEVDPRYGNIRKLKIME